MERLRKMLEFTKHELIQVLPPTIFFLCAFNVVALTTAMVLQEFKIHVTAHAVATMRALAVGKAVLVVNKLSVLRKFDGKPMIYPILFKSAVYTGFVLIVRLLEQWVPGLIESGTFTGANSHLVEILNWRLFAVGQIWILVWFVIYTTAAEVVSLFGLTSRQLFTAFFRQHPATMTAHG